jgi:hypothetical protein
MKEEITDLAEKGRGGGGWRIKTKGKKVWASFNLFPLKTGFSESCPEGNGINLASFC